MDPSSYSHTAIAGAFMRAYHFAYDDKKIFADPLAQRLLIPKDHDACEAMCINTLVQSHPQLVVSSTGRSILTGTDQPGKRSH
ncbi:MAG: hypothetical protein OJF50_002090 [Nitrospira sp.]|jgi:O-methyltransferase involved in polyketide biosynthesis|nr:hypothetical protein [Nitrospira sp.]